MDHDTSPAALRCGSCRKFKEPSEFPPSQRKNGCWCRQCYREKARIRLGAVEREVKCGYCGTIFTSAFRKAQFCSRSCKDHERDRALREANRAGTPLRWCKHCGGEITGHMRSDAIYCSVKCYGVVHGKEWREANRDLHNESNRRAYHKDIERSRSRGVVNSALRRARERGAAVGEFDRMEIFERDGGRCHICGKKCRRDSFHLDHLIPVVAGGASVAENLRVAHPRCNQMRGAGRLPAQLLLIG